MTGSLGYGQFGITLPGNGGSVNYYAHRVAWALSHGVIPEGKYILHHCDTPLCCNNEGHLYPGTHKNNMEDAQARGRLHVPRPGKQTVTDAQLVEMLNLAAAGMRQIDIARTFGVSKTYICLLLKGKRRQDLAPRHRAAEGVMSTAGIVGLAIFALLLCVASYEFMPRGPQWRRVVAGILAMWAGTVVAWLVREVEKWGAQ